MVLFLPPRSRPFFPPADTADEDGVVVVGGDLSRARLLLAYEQGIFPWFDAGHPPIWFSPDPRAVLSPETLHVSRRLARTIRSGRFVCTWNRDFEGVMRGCAENREEGTWIHDGMVRAYVALHRAGDAHSVEVRNAAGALVGGLYGVQRGALFAAESMFHRETDASKVALVHAVRTLFAAGIEVFDVQLTTPHLVSMGAVEIPRREYLARIAQAVRKPRRLTLPGEPLPEA